MNGALQSMYNHDPWVTLTYFMARSTEVAYPRSHVGVYRTIGPLVAIYIKLICLFGITMLISCTRYYEICCEITYQTSWFPDWDNSNENQESVSKQCVDNVYPAKPNFTLKSDSYHEYLKLHFSPSKHVKATKTLRE